MNTRTATGRRVSAGISIPYSSRVVALSAAGAAPLARATEGGGGGAGGP